MNSIIELVKGEIAHNITPVIGWLRWDAKVGRDDSDEKNLMAYRDRLQKAAEDIVNVVLKKEFTRMQADAWERGMTDAKLQALGIRSSVKNPYLEDEKDEENSNG